MPEGTLIERIRDGGIGGRRAQATGAGTLVDRGMKRIKGEGTPELLENELRADLRRWSKTILKARVLGRHPSWPAARAPGPTAGGPVPGPLRAGRWARPGG